MIKAVIFDFGRVVLETGKTNTRCGFGRYQLFVGKIDENGFGC